MASEDPQANIRKLAADLCMLVEGEPSEEAIQAGCLMVASMLVTVSKGQDRWVAEHNYNAAGISIMTYMNRLADEETEH